MDNNPAVNINAMGVIDRATAEGLDAGLIRLKILFKKPSNSGGINPAFNCSFVSAEWHRLYWGIIENYVQSSGREVFSCLCTS